MKPNLVTRLTPSQIAQRNTRKLAIEADIAYQDKSRPLCELANAAYDREFCQRNTLYREYLGKDLIETWRGDCHPERVAKWK